MATCAILPIRGGVTKNYPKQKQMAASAASSSWEIPASLDVRATRAIPTLMDVGATTAIPDGTASDDGDGGTRARLAPDDDLAATSASQAQGATMVLAAMALATMAIPTSLDEGATMAIPAYDPTATWRSW